MDAEQRERITRKLKAAAKKHPHKIAHGKLTYQDVLDSWLVWNNPQQDESDDE